MQTILITGASGAIGGAFVQYYAQKYTDAVIHAISRADTDFTAPNIKKHIISDYSEADLTPIADKIDVIDMAIVTNGILCDGDIRPEKSLRDLSEEKFTRLFAVNTIIPAMLAKVFVPKLNKTNRSVFAALSARVGSISDNHIGGWYAYRASKAALNMIIKNIAIEMGRKNKHAIIVGLHPGTVDSALSKPFQGNVPNGKLFTPDYSVEKLSHVIEGLTVQNSGNSFAWDGAEILP
ncbi:MAG: SDR family NAD(P)-dependent oxidoreductase [Pseudomonadota bacterium]